MKLTILFLGRNGAGPRYAYKMAEALQLNDQKLRIQIVLSSYVDNIDDWRSLKNVELIFVPTYKSTVQFFKEYIKVFKWRVIAKKINNFSPEVIYIPMISLLNPLLLIFLKKTKVIYTLHDPVEHVGERNIFVELIRKFELKKASKVILLNRYFKEYVVKHYKIPAPNIYIIPHAAFFSKDKPKLNLELKNKFLFVGRIEKYKGIELLLDSFTTLINQGFSGNLTIAGKGDLSDFNDKINSLGDRIKVLNQWLMDEEIDSLIRSHDFVILPYIDASQSGVVPVVFANKRIVIATNRGALREQVPDGIGFIVDASVESICNQINSIYNKDIDFLNDRNLKAYNFAINELTWDKSANLLIKCMYD